MEVLRAGSCPHALFPWSPGRASSWCHSFALSWDRPCSGGSHPLPPRGASHLGAGGTTLAGTAGLSSFTLRRRTAGWWHVPKPGSSCLPEGVWQDHQALKWGGRPHPQATYIISVLPRGASGTTGTHGTLGESEDEDAVGDSGPLSPCHRGWAVPGSGSPIPQIPLETPQSGDSVAELGAGGLVPIPRGRQAGGGGGSTHRSTRLSRFTGGTLETLRTLQFGGEKRRKKGGNGLKTKKIGPEDPSGRGGPRPAQWHEDARPHVFV